MTQNDSLRARLDEISERIADAQHQLKLKGLFHKEHAATANELLARHRFLSEELDKEVAELESQGTHVGALARSVLGWVNSLHLDNGR